MSDQTATRLTAGLADLPSGSLSSLRQGLLTNLGRIFIVTSIILLSVSVPDQISDGYIGLLVFDLITFALLVLITLLRNRMPYEQRAFILIAIGFAQGVSAVQGEGIVGDSRVWFMFVAVFSVILLGFRAGMIANAAILVTNLIGAFLVLNGYFPLRVPEAIPYNLVAGNWFSTLPNFILITLVITIATGQIIRNIEANRAQLETAYAETAELSGQLTEDRTLLAQRTTDLERRTRYIEAAADIGKAATSIYRLDELLRRVVDLITERFDFYQAGIFTLDDKNEYAILQAASSEGGKRMLARGHRLRVGSEGMVGYVTSTGQARIALDVGEDAVHFNTPELPNTRSEMALPLFYGGRLIGALDVQSTEANAFNEQDISALTVLADQVSMAINNAMLFEELQSQMERERQAFSDFSRDAWRNLIQRKGTWGYRFANQRVVQTDFGWPEEMSKAYQQKRLIRTDQGEFTICVPVLIGDESVGVIRLKKPDNSIDWTDDEIDLIETLTERLSQALESARLYEASQEQALQEQITADISNQLRQTLDIDTVLKTAARELGDAFQAKEVVIRMAANESK